MKTNVYICFNGASFDYVFDMELHQFVNLWKDQIVGQGYFSKYDEKGNFVVITPSQCGLIEFSGKKS